jgi:hypothetical protein
LNDIKSRKDFSNGPVWDPERERYLRGDTLSGWQPQKKALPPAARSATLVDSRDCENRRWGLERVGSEKCHARNSV